MPKLNKRKCKNCGEEFQKTSPLQSVCGIKCGVERSHELNKKLREKKSKADTKEMKKGLLTQPDYLKLCQKVFNEFIRLRDKDLPCVSCGTFKCEEFHAGHYVASTYQYLRFEEFNVWKQCSKCNTHLRGNLIPYRIELIKRIGLAKVEQLENDRHNNFKLSIPEIIDLIAEYKHKLKDLKKL